jgi:hypothetical protein
MAGHQEFLHLFPIVLSSLLKMSRRYLRYLHHVQDSSSDDENKEDEKPSGPLLGLIVMSH